MSTRQNLGFRLIEQRRRRTALAFLVFSTQPGGANSGSPFSPQPVVTAKNPDGSTNTSFTGNVTLAVNTVTGSHALSGTVTVAAVAGVATFSGVTDTGSGNGTLTASAAGYSSATSASFTTAAGSSHTFADDFAGTDGVEVTTRSNTWSGGAGVGSWVKVGTVNAKIAANRAYGDFDLANYHSAATVAANGILRAVAFRKGTTYGSDTFELRTRRDEVNDSDYELIYVSGTWRLRKRLIGVFGTVTGTPADLSDSWPISEYRTLELETTSSGVIGRIYANDGTTLLGTLTSTDTSVSAAGYVAFHLNSTSTNGTHLDALEFTPT